MKIILDAMGGDNAPQSTVEGAVLAARELGGPIRVVDSLSTCAGLYLLIRRACAMVQAGESLEKVEAEMIALREKGRTYFSVDDMTPLRRSGRLGNVKSSISTILNIKPLLAVREGAVVSVGVARGKIDQMRRLTSFAEGAQGLLVVSHFLATEAAGDLEKQLLQQGRQLLLQAGGLQILQGIAPLPPLQRKQAAVDERRQAVPQRVPDQPIM